MRILWSTEEGDLPKDILFVMAAPELRTQSSWLQLWKRFSTQGVLEEGVRKGGGAVHCKEGSTGLKVRASEPTLIPQSRESDRVLELPQQGCLLSLPVIRVAWSAELSPG